MKAPSAGYRIVGPAGHGIPDRWEVRIAETGKIVWKGKTAKGARNAHYRLAVEKLTGKPVTAAQARRAGNV